MSRIESADQLVKILASVENIKRRFRRWAKRDIADGFNLSDYLVLAQVTETPEQLQVITARRGISQQAVGKVMKRLAAFGFVKVAIEKNDARAKAISLSKKGVRAISKSVKIIEEILKNGEL